MEAILETNAIWLRDVSEAKLVSEQKLSRQGHLQHTIFSEVNVLFSKAFGFVPDFGDRAATRR